MFLSCLVTPSQFS